MNKLLLMVFCSLLCLATAQDNSEKKISEAGKNALGINAGTTGLGLEFKRKINNYIVARASVHALTYETDFEESDIDYDLDIDMLNFGLFIDWHPFGNGLKISAGAVLNNNNYDLQANPQLSYQIGDDVYTPDEVGDLIGELDYKDIAPYIGIGYSNTFGKKGNWSLNLDVGAMYMGTPEVSLTATAGGVDISDLIAEEEYIEDYDSYQWYPIVTITISYRF